MAVFVTGAKKPKATYDENTILLLHGEELTDASMYEQTISNTGVSVSSTQSRFGGKSLYFDGNSHLTVPVTLDGDFTIDFWIYIKQRLSGKDWVCPFHLTQGSSRGLLTYLVSSITYLCSPSTNVTSNTIIGTGTWYHIAVVRNGSTSKMYLNGSLLLTNSNSSFTGDTLAIGYDSLSAGDTPLCGWMDEFRVSNIARWTSNFTPPTEMY